MSRESARDKGRPVAQPVTFTDLRRLLFLVEVGRRALAGAEPWSALSELYRHDEWLVADYDEELIHPEFVAQEYDRAWNTLRALSEPSEMKEQ